ncbi:MAG: hypothetical protein NTY11_01755 [Candidatus Parcubacteria bacterium]|nr:hypothetical protein [Candidatus Parcubacteria bacterium]
MNQEKEQQILSILNDLYSIDAGFKNYEAELKKIVSNIIASKPNIEIDEKFKEKLHLLLIEKIQELKNKKELKSINFINVFMNSKFAYSAAGALLVAIILLPIIFLNQSKTEIPLNPIDSQASFNNKGERAFGSLVFSDQSLSTDGQGLTNTNTESSPVPGAGGGNSPVPLTPGAKSTSAIYSYPPVEITSYSFVYKGEPIVLDEANVNVLRREKNNWSGSFLGSILNKMNLGIINLEKFEGLNLKQLSLGQESDDGYSLYIDFVDGKISISRNNMYYLKNATITNCSSGEKCISSSSLTPSDIPEDSRLIEVAKKFLADHGISVDNYGAPEVNRYWEKDYGIIQDQSSYISENISITYPLIINGMGVYDSSGYKQGMTVSVNIPEMQVTDVYNLTTQKYDSSNYEAETDFNKILDVAKNGGIYRGYNMGYVNEQGKVVELEIGAPKKAYMTFYNYSEGKSEELLVPALLFPILEKPKDAYFYQDNIIVPLAKELLEADNGTPTPIPLLKGIAPLSPGAE